MILALIIEGSERFRLSEAIRSFAIRAAHIKEKIKGRIEIRKVKLQVLHMLWNKLIKSLLRIREKSKDEEMKAQILDISLVPAEVRNAALKYYLTRCYAAYCPAFLEARRMYHNDWHQMEKIKRLIQKRISKTHMEIDALQPQCDIENLAAQPNHTTKNHNHNRQLLQARLVIHGLLERPAPHHIYTFREVALLDPYPKELIIGREAQLFPFLPTKADDFG